jgi:Ca-activated chloride channel homolog
MMVTRTLLPAAALVALASLALSADTPVVRITSPPADALLSGRVRVEAVVTPWDTAVASMTFFANGRQICELTQPPFGCAFDAGAAVRGHHLRVVATLANGRRVVGNLRTRDPGFTERARTHAVLVPVIVLRDGEFVRGLTRQDFQVLENGAPQAIASVGSENIPLELILAVDISGSMEHALDEVKPAVKRLLGKLRSGDAATLVGFNDTTFIAAEREKDPVLREQAVDLLSPWGATALYDTTVRVLDLVSREWGRRGIVLFTDGDDTASRTTREAALERVQASDAMLYTIGFGGGATVPRLRESLEQYARTTGGRAFFPRNAAELDRVFDQIVAELANQYVLSYAPPEAGPGWRNITVKVRNCRCDVRARRGYRLDDPRQAGR